MEKSKFAQSVRPNDRNGKKFYYIQRQGFTPFFCGP